MKLFKFYSYWYIKNFSKFSVKILTCFLKKKYYCFCYIEIKYDLFFLNIIMAYSNHQNHHKKTKKTLSWSNTRITLLEYCERKYFLNYYTFALKKDNPDIWSETLVLKWLKSIEMWIGEKSHFLLSDYLHALKKWEINDEKIEELKENMRNEMKADFDYSRERDYNEREDFFGKFWLSEHFYEENIENLLEPAIQKVCDNLDRFIDSNWNQKVQDYFKDAKYVYVEHPRNPDFDSMKVDVSKIPWLKDISILAWPDFWVTFSDTDYLILDWKSGKEDVLDNSISDQLKVYALKMLLKRWTTSLTWIKIEAYEVYLNSMNSYGWVLKQEDIDWIISKIQKDTQEQKNLLVDQDPYKNEPVDLMMFRKTSSNKKCESCTFRSICKKLK